MKYVVVGRAPTREDTVVVGPYANLVAARAAEDLVIWRGYYTEIVELAATVADVPSALEEVEE